MDPGGEILISEGKEYKFLYCQERIHELDSLNTAVQTRGLRGVSFRGRQTSLITNSHEDSPLQSPPPAWGENFIRCCEELHGPFSWDFLVPSRPLPTARRLWLRAYLVTVTVNSPTIPWVLTLKGIIKGIIEEIFRAFFEVCVTLASLGWGLLWNPFLKLGAGNTAEEKNTHTPGLLEFIF